MATASNKSRSDTGGFLGGETGNETKGAGQERRDIPDAKKMLIERERK